MTTATKEIISELQKLSTENLIIWIVGKSREINTILTIEEIVLEAWKINPAKHSMRGHSKYPDSFVVIKRIYDMKGRKGLLTGGSHKGFSLTPISQTKYEDIKHLIFKGKVKSLTPAFSADRTISSIEEAPYRRLVNSPSYVKYTNGNLERIVETDYLYFYGLNWHTKSTLATNKIKNVEKVVSQFTTKDPDLKKVMDFLNQKFADVREKIMRN